MKLSVIVPTLHRPEDLARMLDSAALQSRPAEEIWVIDQSEDDRTRRTVDERREALKAKGTRLEYRHRTIKSGAQARNEGMDLAGGDAFGFLDDDVVLEPGYFEAVAGAFESHPDWAGLAGNARVDRSEWLSPKWKLRLFLWRLFLIEGAPGRATLSGFGHPIFDRTVDRLTRVDFLPGCNMWLTRRAVGVDRFDPWFEGYSYREDAEFSYRISLRGPLWMVPEAGLEHRYSPSSRMDPAALKRMEIRNYAYVFRKLFPQTFFRKALFAFSLTGILLIDLIEWLSGFDAGKRVKLAASFQAARTALFGNRA